MGSRSFVIGGGVALALAAFVPLGDGAANAARPNVVAISTDDQTLASLTPATMPRTLELIAGSGTTFTNVVATTPQCCPSRASLLTGQYAHNHGALHNDYGLLRAKSNTLPVWLKRAGYETIHIGKYLNRYDASRSAPGWTEWYTRVGGKRYYNYTMAKNGRLVEYGDRPRHHFTRVVREIAVNRIRQLGPGRRPFYLQLDQSAPHAGPDPSGRCAGFAVPEPRDAERFGQAALPRPPSFNEDDISDKPQFLWRPSLSEAQIADLTRRHRCGLESLVGVDRGVEWVVEALRGVHELDDTVIIVTSDNGFFFGEHRRLGKILPYEEALRVPLLMRVPPELLAGGPAPKEIAQPVANIDLAPTILGFANGRPCRRAGICRVMDGRSLEPLLQGDFGSWPDDRAVVVEHSDYAGMQSSPGASCKAYAGVRVPGRILIEHRRKVDQDRRCEDGLQYEHYDLVDDPFQLENLSPVHGDPAAEAELLVLLKLLQDCRGIAGRDPPPPGGRSHCQ